MAKGNFKVRAIKTYDDFTVEGKVYEFIDGKTTWEKGMTSCFYSDFEDFLTRNGTHFYGVLEEILVVETGNFKVKALRTDSGYFTKGNIYEFINGKTTWDNERSSEKYISFENFITRNSGWKMSFKEFFDEATDKVEEVKFTKAELEAMPIILSYGVDKLREVIGLSEGILDKMKKLEG